MKAKRLMQTVASWCYRLVLIACATITVFVTYQRINGVQIPMILGWGAATVVSGSMEPEIPTTSLIFIQEQDFYKLGDIIVYQSENSNKSITHRIISIEGDTVITQGDANNVADPPLSINQIIGKVQFWTPALGNLTDIIKSLFFVGLGIYAIVYCMEAVTKKRTPGQKAVMQHLPSSGAVVELDMGIKYIAVSSDGTALQR